MAKRNKNSVQSNKITTYFTPLPVRHRRAFLVRNKYTYTPPNMTAGYQGILPSPTQRNIRTTTCQLHYAVGWEPDSAYVLRHLAEPQQQIIARILLQTTELTIQQRVKLLYTYAVYLIDMQKRSVFCYGPREITLNSKVITYGMPDMIISYELCSTCVDYLVGTLGYFELRN